MHVKQLALMVQAITLSPNAHLARPMGIEFTVGPIWLRSFKQRPQTKPIKWSWIIDRYTGEIGKCRQQIDGTADLGRRFPASIFAGQRMNSGDLTPPSSVDPLRPFMPPFHRSLLGPLSEKNTTMVLSASSRSSNLFNSRPT